jgi:endonuclease III related protein
MKQTVTDAGSILKRYYSHLLKQLGPQGWWPGRTRLEIILGTILTQNTSWTNAALALQQLRQRRLLTLARLRAASSTELEANIRPAGSFRQKARTIRTFIEWLSAKYGGSLRAMFARPAAELRSELLRLSGLGPETVDAILLYAGRQPFFVADGYTRRILARHKLVPAGISYPALQQFIQQELPADHLLFNEFHALLVEVGKRWCKRAQPDCDDCVLREFLPAASRAGETGMARLSTVAAPRVQFPRG